MDLDIKLNIRISPEQRQTLEDASYVFGIRDKSEILRRAIRKALKTPALLPETEGQENILSSSLSDELSLRLPQSMLTQASLHLKFSDSDSGSDDREESLRSYLRSIAFSAIRKTMQTASPPPRLDIPAYKEGSDYVLVP